MLQNRGRGFLFSQAHGKNAHGKFSSAILTPKLSASPSSPRAEWPSAQYPVLGIAEAANLDWLDV